MSFSITLVGKPEAIKRQLAKESARLTDVSKTEFDAVHVEVKSLGQLAE